MFGKLVLRLAVILFFISFHFNAQAQPLMPDMIGASQNGINLITWTCQYNGVKTISVQRSSDSVYNYVTIGYVKNIAKGQQAFLDGHAKAGDNWYRLCIVFGSELTWYSNSLKLKLDSSWVLKQKSMPSNDSLQKYAANVKITEAPSEPQPKTTTPPTQIPAGSMATTVKPFDTARTIKPGLTAGHATATTNGQKTPGVGNILDSVQRKKDSIRRMVVTTINATSSTVTTNTQPAQPTQPKIVMPKIVADTDPALYIKSQYVFTNPYSGHVNVEIPDARKYLYSIKFFDAKGNHVILELLRVVEPLIIIDKRNFQRKGSYKFELMKEHAKLETGYISIY